MAISPYQELANAIIVQAAKDYQEAYKLTRKYNPKKHGGYMRMNKELKEKFDRARYVRGECAKFFRSEYYKVLTNVEPEVLLKMLDESVA